MDVRPLQASHAHGHGYLGCMFLFEKTTYQTRVCSKMPEYLTRKSYTKRPQSQSLIIGFQQYLFRDNQNIAASRKPPPCLTRKTLFTLLQVKTPLTKSNQKFEAISNTIELNQSNKLITYPHQSFVKKGKNQTMGSIRLKFEAKNRGKK